MIAVSTYFILAEGYDGFEQGAIVNCLSAVGEVIAELQLLPEAQRIMVWEAGEDTREDWIREPILNTWTRRK